MCYRSGQRHKRSRCLEWWPIRLCFQIALAIFRCGPDFSRILYTCIHPTLSKQTLSCYCFSTIRFLKWFRTEDWIRFKSSISLLGARSWRFLFVLLFFFTEKLSVGLVPLWLLFCYVRSHLYFTMYNVEKTIPKKWTIPMEQCRRNICFETGFILPKISLVNFVEI